MYKLTVLDSVDTPIEIDEAFSPSGKSKELQKITSDIQLIRNRYQDRGNPLTGFSVDFVMELLSAGWKMKSLHAQIGAAQMFLLE